MTAIIKGLINCVLQVQDQGAVKSKLYDLKAKEEEISVSI